MESCDALVVGGGPAGASCAWKLRQAGLDVLVMDKSRFPRDKVCGGWITPAVIKALRIDTGEYAQGRVLQPISAFRTGLIGRQSVLSEYPEPVSFGIRRCEFDHFLLTRSGARLKLGEPLKSLERRNDGWIANDHIKTPLVIGAGGHFCPVARTVGGSLGNEPIVAAQEIEFEMSPDQVQACQVQATIPELYFCEDWLGYGWCFRKGNFLNIGLGRNDKRELGRHAQDFCSWLQKAGRVPWQFSSGLHGHAYLLYGQSRRRLVDAGVMLIGDAAGLANDRSGEGIRPAVESGLLAADTVLACKGDYSKEKLSAYVTSLRQCFGSPASSGLTAHLPNAVRRSLARMLFASPWFARHVLIERCFLNLHRPSPAF